MNNAPSEIFADDDIGAILADLADASARKRWLTSAYADEMISADQIAFWFYVYGLRHA